MSDRETQMKKKTVVTIFLILVASAGYLLLKNNNADKKDVKLTEQESQKKLVGSLIKKRINKALKKSHRNESNKEENANEAAFIQKTELEPLSREEVKSLKGESLRKRLQDLDSKLDDAIQKYPDLPPPPEWYKEEMEYLGNKYFKTSGKSKYKTGISEEEQEKRERYVEYLERIEQEGLDISSEELAEQKRKIIGE